MVNWGAFGEAVASLGRHNIDVEQAFDILTGSSGAIGPAKARQGPIIDLIKNGQSGAWNTAKGAKGAGWDKKDISLLAAWRTRGD